MRFATLILDVQRVLRDVFRWLRNVGERVLAPLRKQGGPNKFRLSSADTGTTTYDGSVGWGNRPPAVLECPRCATDIFQHNALDGIDCPRCVAEFSYEEFADLELRYLQCPVCRSEMQHGQRHPHQFDFPEWATCDGCRYHWEFKHSY
jgi:DNA-directed RNA polymerase subunit RPC12/RpoP